jgi:2-polyprenyl-6-methoxyphenol hydroxylase-like FAD-dependent oxidoreductase
MAATSYDAVTVAGGVAGAVFAKAMAERGAKVLVLERETRFKDRVRGEMLVPWGVAEARELGILPALKAACAHEVGLVEMGAGPRDLAATTEHRCPAVTFAHQEMQETLLGAAELAGA